MSAASRLWTALRLKAGNGTGPDAWKRVTGEALDKAVDVDLERVLDEHEKMRAGLCVIMNRCRDREGYSDWMLDRDKIGAHIQLLLISVFDEEAAP